MKSKLQERLEFGVNLANEAADIMVYHADSSDLGTEEKDDGTIATIVDREINRLVLGRIGERYPDDGILCEESDSEAYDPERSTWVIDELDGTVPYAKGMANCAFSLALVQDGEPLFGVVCEPMGRRRRMYTAMSGEQTHLNGTPIRVSKSPLGRRALLNVEWWPFAEEGFDIERDMHQLSLATKSYVLHGGSTVSAGVAVARGASEACVSAVTIGKFMDVAALIPIVQGAGGRVTDLRGTLHRIDGSPIKGAVISNGVVHDELLEWCRR